MPAHAELAAHVREAVRRAEFSADPFPYLFATDLVPDPFYAELDASWPRFEEMYRGVPTIGRLDFSGGAFKGPHGEAAPTALSPAQLNNWAIFRALINGPFFEAAFDRFKPHLAAFGSELLLPSPLAKTSAWSRMIQRFAVDRSFWKQAAARDFESIQEFLTNRKDASVLSPHTDAMYNRFTLIAYFAPDRAHQHLGTRLYRHKGEGRARLPSEGDAPDAQFASTLEIPCEEVRALPFLPNAVVIFWNGPRSWHGQQLGEPIERRSYNSFFTVRVDRVRRSMRPADIKVLEDGGAFRGPRARVGALADIAD